jgi:hypothetical protein
VFERGRECRLADAERLGGNRYPSAVERPHRKAEAVARGSEQTFSADAYVPELQIHAAKAAHTEGIGGGHAGNADAVHRHKEGTDAAASKSALRGCEDQHEISGGRVRDPDLTSVEGVAALVKTSDRLLIRRVGAGVLFGEREGSERLAAGEPPQPGVLLRVGTEAGDRLRDKRVVDRGNHRDNGAGVGERFDRERVADVVLAGAAPFAGDRHPHQSERRRFAHEIARERAAFVNHGCLRRHPLARKCLYYRLKRLLLFAELEFHGVRRSNSGRRRAAVTGSSSGRTRVSPTTVMKLVSPFQRGTTCR